MSTTRCHDCGADTGKLYARYCPACRWRHQGKPATHKLTPERVAYLREHYRPSERGVSFRIAAVLQVPKWRVCRWAAELGLTGQTTKGPDWTPQEDAFLEQHIQTRHPNWIAKSLRRSMTAVVVRAKRLRLSRKADGYSQTDVAIGFGVSRDSVERWQRQGWLVARPIGHHSGYSISDAAIRRFIAAHPTTFTLAKVDQVWFLSLLLGGFESERAA